MSKFVLSFIGHGLKKSQTSSAQTTTLPNILHRLSSHQFNYYGSSASLHTYQNILNNNSSSLMNKKLTFNGDSITVRKNLYTDASLGIYKLDSLRENRMKLYETGKERYIERIAKYVEGGDIKSIYKDDLINLIALAETENHLDLIEKIATLTKADHQLVSGSWGSAVMRLYYKMNQLDRAVENIKNIEKYGDFFNQRTSYQIVMTMLYNGGRYQDLMEIYELSVDRLNKDDSDKKYETDRRLSFLVFAAYAKLNTKEALEAAEKLYLKDQINPFMKMRVITFLSYLAVNQDKPATALNLLSDSPHKNYISTREIKTIALMKLKRYEDVLYHIRESITETKREFKIMIQEVCDLLESRMEEISDEQVRKEITDTLVELKQNQLISDATLDSIVFKEVNQDQRERLDYKQEANNMSTRYNNRPRYNDRYNRNDRYSDRMGIGGGRMNRSRENRFDLNFEETNSRNMFNNNRDGRNNNMNDYNNNARQNNNYNNRGNRRQPKSYFEDDLDDDELDEANIDKRFR